MFSSLNIACLTGQLWLAAFSPQENVRSNTSYSYEEAYYRQALSDQDPAVVQAAENWLLVQQDQVNKRLSRLIDAYDALNHDPLIALEIAKTYEKLNKSTEAEGYYIEALSSSDPAVVEKTTKALIQKTQNTTENLSLLIQSYELMDHDPKIALRVAATFDKLNRPHLAECYYKEALLSIDPAVRKQASDILNSRNPEQAVAQPPAAVESEVQLLSIPEVIETPVVATEAVVEVVVIPTLTRFYELKMAAEESFTTAKKELNNLLCEDPTNVTANLEMAYLHLGRCQHRMALGYLINAYEFGNRDPKIALQIAYTYDHLNERDKADLYYREAANGSDLEAKQAAQRELSVRGVPFVVQPEQPVEQVIEPSVTEEKIEVPIEAPAEVELVPVQVVPEPVVPTPEQPVGPPSIEPQEKKSPHVEVQEVPKQCICEANPLSKYYEERSACRFKEAQIELKNVLKEHPESPKANLEMGLLLQNKLRHEESLPYFFKAYDQMEQDPLVALQIASVYEGTGKLKKAKFYYAQAAISADEDIEIQGKSGLQNLSNIKHPPLTEYYELRQANELAKAREELQRILQNDPASTEANLEMGYLLIGDHKDAESLPYFIKAYNVNKDPKVALQIAYIFDALMNFNHAKLYYEQAAASTDEEVKNPASQGLVAVIEKIKHPPLSLYYDLRKGNEVEKARAELDRILSIDPSSKEANLEMAYLLINDHKEARSLPYLQRAYEADQDQKIALQIAYIYDQLGQSEKSDPYFRLAASSNDADVRKQATDSLAAKADKFMGGQGCKTKLFRPFMEFYNETIFFDRFSNWVCLMDAKIGVNLSCENRDQAYLQMRYVADTQSKGGNCESGIPNQTVIGQTPIILDDPIFLIAGGYRHRFFKHHALYAYVSVGIAYDLVYRLRNVSRGDLRTGLNYYVDWKKTVMLPNTTCCISQLGDLNADFSYYSRYRYWIGYATLKEGIYLIDQPCCDLRAYIRLFGAVDTKGEFFNNVIEVGPYLEATPLKMLPIKLAIYWLQGFYYRNGGTSVNPYGPRYTDFRFMGTVATSF
ncbi:MAG: hypothetical protein H0X51_07620 [Parachlamydiaceae bacterium]|nr:hypothetical protein [Parachlamydiaceae bacterium]